MFFDISPLRGVSSFGSKHILLSKLRSQITSPSPEPKGRLFLKKRAREVHPGARSAFRRGYRANTETQATKPNQKSEARAEKKIIVKKRAREARPGARSALRRGYRANTVTQTTKPNQKSEPRAEKKIIFLKNGRAKRALACGTVSVSPGRFCVAYLRPNLCKNDCSQNPLPTFSAHRSYVFRRVRWMC